MEPSQTVETEQLLDMTPNRMDDGAAALLRERIEADADLQTRAALMGRLHAFAQSQSTQLPPEGAFQKITTTISMQRNTTSRARFFWAAVCLAILLFSWALAQPAVTIRMNSTFESLQGYQVFRAADGSDAYRLIGEIPAGEAGSVAFRDFLVLPFVQYSYQIIGMDQDGQQVASPQIMVNSSPVGWTLILLFLFSLGVTFILYTLTHSRPSLTIQSIA